jgi:hypothetical protein
MGNKNQQSEITPISWGYSAKGIAIRLFLTCWLIYSMHFATNIVREIFPALALGDHLSFRVDEYANMHPDLFEKPGYGWHIGNNPGVSMLAAIPYALARPVIDPIVVRVNQSRISSGQSEPINYDSPWPMARQFYAESWRRGYDIKFALGAFVMQALCMAPITALSVVFMFYLLREIFHSDKVGLFLAVLYAFGTPVFFRTGYLNQNLMLGIFAFMGFLTMWNPWGSRWGSPKLRYFLGGLAGGTAFLFDYSGLVLLVGLFAYGMIKAWREQNFREAFRLGLFYIVGALGPILLLWFYQWQSFGNPFLPGQHWMPPVEWSELGYQGFGLPQLDLFLQLGFDYRFGLFVSSPLMILALAAPFLNHGQGKKVPQFELYFILALCLTFWIFFSGSNYVRLQFNTGIRYLTPLLPFMFIPAVIVLMRLPNLIIGLVTVASFAQSWALAMYREVESRFGMLDPILRTFIGGFQLPVLRTISRSGLFSDLFPSGVSPLPIFLLASGILFVIWSPILFLKKTND